MIQPGVSIKAAALHFRDATGHRLTLLDESIILVRLQRECMFSPLLVSDDSIHLLELKALCALGRLV